MVRISKEHFVGLGCFDLNLTEFSRYVQNRCQRAKLQAGGARDQDRWTDRPSGGQARGQDVRRSLLLLPQLLAELLLATGRRPRECQEQPLQGRQADHRSSVAEGDLSSLERTIGPDKAQLNYESKCPKLTLENRKSPRAETGKIVFAALEMNFIYKHFDEFRVTRAIH